MVHQQPPPRVATENTEENRIFNENGKEKQIYRNRHYILFGQIQNLTKPFTHILGRGKEKPGRLCHKTPPDMAP